MEQKYLLLREKYRDFVQNILNVEGEESRQKARYSLVYRQRNVKKSIDTALRDYIEEKTMLGTPLKITDAYWLEYDFSDNIRQLDWSQQLLDFQRACMSYFSTSNPIPVEEEGGENRKEDGDFDPSFFLKSYLSNDMFTKMFQDISQFTHTADCDGQRARSNESLPIEFPEEIVKLAQELSSEIQIPDFLNIDGDGSDTGAPKRIFDKLTTAEGQEMFRGLIQKTSDKIKRKIDSGEIDEEKIKNSAQNCLKAFMEKNGELQDILNKNFSGQAFDLFNQQASQSAATANKPASDTRMRLQKKLKKRQSKEEASAHDSNF